MAKKNKVLFACCKIQAVGFRGRLHLDGFTKNYAKCPKCGRLQYLD